MRVMGVDPGLTRCGVGIVEGELGKRPKLVAVGVIRTSADLSHERRLLQIDEGLAAWQGDYRPDVIAVERVFAQHNLHSVTGTAQAAGIAMLLAAKRAIPVELRTPSEVKAALTGSGRAGKSQVGYMVAQVLGLASPPKPVDAADALAIAICQIWRSSISGSRYAQLADAHDSAAVSAERLNANRLNTARVSADALASSPALVRQGSYRVLPPTLAAKED